MTYNPKVFCTNSNCLVDGQKSYYACQDVCGEETYKCGSPLDTSVDPEGGEGGSSSDDTANSGGDNNSNNGGGSGSSGSDVCDLSRYGVTSGDYFLTCTGGEQQQRAF